MLNESDSAIDSEKVLRDAKILWQKYFTLTKELLKYSSQKDSELFMEMVDQRGQLIEKIKALPENNYRQTEECQALIKQMVPMDKQIMYQARAWLNKSKRRNSAVRSYDISSSLGTRGTVFNRQY
ncbi:MAG: flagellar protein FliT [Selenomonadaceae bacterium]|nr:flagellar protein FliT [Selenomonadaceae bacterium]